MFISWQPINPAWTALTVLMERLAASQIRPAIQHAQVIIIIIWNIVIHYKLFCLHVNQGIEIINDKGPGNPGSQKLKGRCMFCEIL